MSETNGCFSVWLDDERKGIKTKVSRPAWQNHHFTSWIIFGEDFCGTNTSNHHKVFNFTVCCFIFIFNHPIEEEKARAKEESVTSSNQSYRFRSWAHWAPSDWTDLLPGCGMNPKLRAKLLLQWIQTHNRNGLLFHWTGCGNPLLQSKRDGVSGSAVTTRRHLATSVL